MAINNNDVTGNRDIDYNRPIHIDRIERTFNNMGENISNISLDMVKTNITAQQNDDQSSANVSYIRNAPTPTTIETSESRIKFGGSTRCNIFQTTSEIHITTIKQQLNFMIFNYLFFIFIFIIFYY